MAKLSDIVVKWASRPLEPGQGLHTDIFRAAILMLEAGHNRDAVFALLREAANQVQDRNVPDREVWSAIDYAEARLRGETVAGPSWPKFEPVLREEIVRHSCISTSQLADSSLALPQVPRFYLEQLYAPDEFVCVGESAHVFFTDTRDAVILSTESRSFEYINPSAMTGRAGLTRDGLISAHCADNTGPKTYQVVEFDFGHVQEHAAILYWLARQMPLVMLVYSGGKSLHGWFNVKNQSAQSVELFFASAVQLGADAKLWSKCQFSRLPAGQNRKTGKQQSVVLFEPKHLS